MRKRCFSPTANATRTETHGAPAHISNCSERHLGKAKHVRTSLLPCGLCWDFHQPWHRFFWTLAVGMDLRLHSFHQGKVLSTRQDRRMPRTQPQRPGHHRSPSQRLQGTGMLAAVCRRLCCPQGPWMGMHPPLETQSLRRAGLAENVLNEFFCGRCSWKGRSGAEPLLQ